MSFGTHLLRLPVLCLFCLTALAGSGAHAQAKVQAPATAADANDAVDAAQREVERLQREQRKLLAQIRREIELLPAPPPDGAAGTPEQEARDERRRQLIALLADIEKRVNDEKARPRTRYVNPINTHGDFATYYAGMCRKIEERGTKEFPADKGNKLYGELIMNMTVDAQGRLVGTDVVRPSDSRVLDRRAANIVRAAAPFGRFSEPMRREADRIVVTSRFRFTRDEGSATAARGCSDKT